MVEQSWMMGDDELKAYNRVINGLVKGKGIRMWDWLIM